MSETYNAPPVVMTFSGHDPSGGAGIQADIESVASVGCHCTPVITAITAQDSFNVKDFNAVDSTLVIEQARAVLEDMPVAAIKLGMLGSVENIEAIHTILSDYPNIPVVLDPILSAGGGAILSDDIMADALRALILPLTTITTPNTPELHYLAPEADSLEAYVGEILETGCENVLVTGTHDNTKKVINKLYNDHGFIRDYSYKRLPHIYHGSGCTLAANLAANLSHGLDICQAVEMALDFTWKSLSEGRRIGMGQLIPHRFFWSDRQD